MRSLPVAGSCVLSLVLSLAGIAGAEGCCKELAHSVSPLQQATQADVVVIGKVVDLEPDLTMMEQYPGGGKIGHMIANIRIEESLLGAKGLTHLRVAYVPSNRPIISDDAEFNARVNGVRFWWGNLNLVQGQEACFLLRKHPTADCCALLEYSYPMNKGDLNYETEIKAVRNIMKAFDKPIEALQSKDAGERQLAACALVMRYRMHRNGATATGSEPIPADESKAILKALGEMKWGELPFDPNGTFSVQGVFYQLGLSANDGWQQPQQKENEDYSALMDKAVSKWFKDNAEKYRIQRLVVRPQSKE